LAGPLLALLTLGACLSDEALRIECREDTECADQEQCIERVCVDTSRIPLTCPTGISICDDQCIDTDRSPDHCGVCDTPCHDAPFQRAECLAGACARTCAAGHYDLDPEIPGCEYACTPTSPSREVCDGVDNDCDGLVDNDDPSLEAPACPIQEGVCAGARMECRDDAPVECEPEDYAEHAPEQWEERERRCDGLDNDCDGRVDPHCCAPTDTPYVLVADRREIALHTRMDDALPVVTSLSTFPAAVVTRSAPAVGLSALLDERAIDACGANPVLAGTASRDGALLLIACDAAPLTLHAVDTATDATKRVFTLPAGARVDHLTVDTRADAISYAVAWRTIDGDPRAHIGFESDEIALVTGPFEPPTPNVEALSAFATPSGPIAIFATRTDGDVWLQRLDTSLALDGFATRVVRAEGWNEDTPLATAALRLSSESTMVAFPGDSGALHFTTVTTDPAETGTELTASPAHHVTLHDQRPDGVRVTALHDEAISVWLVHPDGSVVTSWTLPVSGPGDAKSAPAALVHEGDAHIAVGSPDQGSAATTGLLFYRLGLDSHPLCR
jgi:hypothetical protein